VGVLVQQVGSADSGSEARHTHARCVATSGDIFAGAQVYSIINQQPGWHKQPFCTPSVWVGLVRPITIVFLWDGPDTSRVFSNLICAGSILLYFPHIGWQNFNCCVSCIWAIQSNSISSKNSLSRPISVFGLPSEMIEGAGTTCFFPQKIELRMANPMFFTIRSGAVQSNFDCARPKWYFVAKFGLRRRPNPGIFRKFGLRRLNPTFFPKHRIEVALGEKDHWTECYSPFPRLRRRSTSSSPNLAFSERTLNFFVHRRDLIQIQPCLPWHLIPFPPLSPQRPIHVCTYVCVYIDMYMYTCLYL